MGDNGLWRVLPLLCVVCLASVDCRSRPPRVSFVDPKSSFAQHQQWRVSSNGTLTFSFKTFLKDALLIYQDDGVMDYFNLELKVGRLLLNIRTGRKTSQVTLGNQLNDLSWHQVSIHVEHVKIGLTLDDHTRVVKIPRKNLALKNNPSRYLYFGGLPRSLSISTLSFPAVVFAKRFTGCIKDVEIQTGNGVQEELRLVESKGRVRGCRNACRSNPCQNGGRCINKIWSSACDCSGTGFYGNQCTEEPPRLSMTASDYVIHDMSQEATATFYDHVVIDFRATSSDGIILQTSFASDFLLVELHRGVLVMQLDIGAGMLKLSIGEKLSDARWHRAEIKRARRNVKLTLDERLKVDGTCPPSLTAFNMQGGEGRVYIGGVSDPTRSKNSVSRKNFEGCIRKLVFNFNEYVGKVKARHASLKNVGKVSLSCPTPTTTSSLETTMTTSFSTEEPLKPSEAPTPIETQVMTSVKQESTTGSPVTEEVEVTIPLRKCPWSSNKDCDRERNSVKEISTTRRPRKSTHRPKKPTRRPRKNSPRTRKPTRRPRKNTHKSRRTRKTTPQPTTQYYSTSHDPMTSQSKKTACGDNGCTTEETMDTMGFIIPPTPTGGHNVTSDKPVMAASGGPGDKSNIGTVIGLVVAFLCLVGACAFVSRHFNKKRHSQRQELLGDINDNLTMPDGKSGKDEFLV